MTTTIDVSAQFGGDDAAQAVLPHFRALKKSLKGISFEGFPFGQLTFILRVAGNVHDFGAPGPGNVRFGKNNSYVSVDIVIDRGTWTNTTQDVGALTATSIISCAAVLREQSRLQGADWGAVDKALQEFVAAYRSNAPRTDEQGES